MSENTPPKRRKPRRRWIALAVLVLLVWRAWPFVAAFTGAHVRVTEAPRAPDAGFVPLPTVPAELRSGLSRLGLKLAGESVFLPRVVRHGNGFKRNDPALPAAQGKQLAELLADPASYEAWGGEKACGGFHGDWYLRWGEGADRREVIVCEGCGEAILYHAGKSLRCDLPGAVLERIDAITRTPDTR